MKNKSGLLGAGWYAAGAVCVVPIAALLFAAFAVALLACWPLVVILMYYHRREEIAKAEASPAVGIPVVVEASDGRCVMCSGGLEPGRSVICLRCRERAKSGGGL